MKAVTKKISVFGNYEVIYEMNEIPNDTCSYFTGNWIIKNKELYLEVQNKSSRYNISEYDLILVH